MFGNAMSITKVDFLAEAQQHLQQLIKILLLVLKHDFGSLLKEFTHFLHQLPSVFRLLPLILLKHSIFEDVFIKGTESAEKGETLGVCTDAF